MTTKEDVLKQIDKSKEFIFSKGELILTIKLENIEAADRLMEWMYGKHENRSQIKGIKIQAVAWDSVVVSKEKIESLKDILTQ